MELVIAIAFGLGLAALSRKPASSAPPASTGASSSAGGAAPGGAAAAGSLAAGAAVAGAVGGAFGKVFADNFTGTGVGSGPKLSQQVAVPVGATVGAGAYLAVGGVSGATAIVGGAVLPAIALIVVPAVVVIAIVLSYVQIFDTQAKMKRWTELYQLVHAKIAAGDYAGAWKVAEDAATKENLPGLGFTTSAKAAIPATVRLTNGQTLNVAQTVAAAYAKGQHIGDQYANAINAAVPWMCTTYKSGDQVFVRPNGSVIVHLSPYWQQATQQVPAEWKGNVEGYELMMKLLAEREAAESDTGGTGNTGPEQGVKYK